MNQTRPLISVIIPCYNEASNIAPFFADLSQTIRQDRGHDFEFIFVNDGSTDTTLDELHKLASEHDTVNVLSLSRNFGKEIAITAGVEQARGDALIMIDGDGQHPPKLIPEFIRHWQNGAQVVIGVRRANQKEGLVKHYGSQLFYRLYNHFSGVHLVPGSTDFRLIDRAVQAEFIRLTERNRITRGLIDWLGFRREYVTFTANPRLSGHAGYNVRKLTGLAVNSFISMSLRPLYFAIFVGCVILPLSVLLGLFSLIETLIGDPLHLRITGTAYLVILALFMIGLVLISQGITALYLAHIHTETKNRPLFIIDRKASILHKPGSDR